MPSINILQGDAVQLLDILAPNSIDLTVTSPPYDNIRAYDGNAGSWGQSVWEAVFSGLFRVTALGGVVVWIVNDATIKGDETGTGFKQALFAKSVGFKLFDTMIWAKPNPTPCDPRAHRYTSSFEYMFVLSKGAPQRGELQRTECVTAGARRLTVSRGSQLGPNGEVDVSRNAARTGTQVQETKILNNVWDHAIGSDKHTGHPAAFPLRLAKDHILSWSNEGDTVLDPFSGSGTTGLACAQLGRHFIGFEINPRYVKIAQQRLQEFLEPPPPPAYFFNPDA